ncbi:MAG TPA: ABC transporter permease [Candidatus Methylomirabilis sp.]|nr:ABC transporter permease [Candidatus Methylomirabilis sp.]
MGRLVALIRKEFIQFFRYRPLVILVVWTIALEIAICAYAITYDVTHLSVAVQDLDGSPESRQLISRFAQTEYFDIKSPRARGEEIEDLLASGRADLVLRIPPDFSRQLGMGLQAPVQLLLDGSNSNAALIGLGYAQRIVQTSSREIEIARLRNRMGDLGSLPGVRNQPQAWYNPNLKSVHFVVVSMLVLGVMMIATIHPAAAVAWEKEAGTIEQLLVMPFRTWELMVAKVVPTFVVSLVSLALALWVPWWFQVPIRGRLSLFFALSAVFLFSSLGWGLFLGTIARNLQQALLLSFFSIFPIMVISGTLVPVESMPRVIQLLSYLSPLTYYLEVGLGIFLKGVGMQVLWPQTLAMGGLGVGIFGLGLWRFGRHLG